MNTDDVDNDVSLLCEGETCERIATARRVAVLIDPAAYFGALRQALLKARRHVVICGWDVDGRMRLVGPSNEAEDGAPERLREFLGHLVEQRPELRIDVVLWDYTALYALDREAFPRLNLGWMTPAGIRLTLDNAHPVESSQHQKIVVVDGQLAFCGGIDLAARRWDTSEHLAEDPRRRDPSGNEYEPFHDMQMMVDGDAAAALSDIANERLTLAGVSQAADTGSAPADDHDLWPEGIGPTFRDVRVGIALSRPLFGEISERRQVEALFTRSIAVAERMIYIENQYVTADVIADALIDRLRDKPDLEVVVVSPLANHGWLERHTMAAGRAAFARRIADAGVGDRVAIMTPVVGGDTQIMVHAKAMIVDERLFRVGSSNLNNRSMGLDSECDLIVEASSDAERQIIGGLRSRLIGEHLGCDPGDVDDAIKAHDGSLFGAIKSLSGGDRDLIPVDSEAVAAVDPEELRSLLSVADPDRPISIEDIVDPDEFGGGRGSEGGRSAGRLRRFAPLVALISLFAGLALAWQYTPLADLTSVSEAERWLEGWMDTPWSPLVVLALFVVLGLLVFPVTVLIAATAMLFGPWLGFAYALGGSVASAVVAYGAGNWFGKSLVRSFPLKVTERASKALGRHGVVAIVVMRLLPVAPFTVVNVLAGASHVSFRDFVLGTVIGMSPGIALMAALGSSLGDLLRAPSAEAIAWVVGAVVLVAVWTWVVRRFLARRARLTGS